MISFSSADEDKDRSSAVSAAWAQCLGTGTHRGIWASALDHAQPISCEHNRSAGTALTHVTQGSYKPVGKPQGREARGLKEADWNINNHGSQAAQEDPGCAVRCVARMISIDYLVKSVLCHHICSFFQVGAALNDLGSFVLAKQRVPSPVRPSLAGPGPHGMFMWLGHWCFPSWQHLLPAGVN